MTALVIQGMPPELLKREALEDHVERMIALLDMLDGDLDLEPDNDEGDTLDEHGEHDTADDEPTLGWNAAGCTSGGHRGQDGELEPSLGSLGSCGRESMPQTLWAAGSRSDREQDVGDDRELDPDTHEADTDAGGAATVDDEPTLGWNAVACTTGGCRQDGEAERSLGASEPDWSGVGAVGTMTGYVRFPYSGTDQTRWAQGGSDDDREAGDDNGLGDQGGAAEAFYGEDGTGDFPGGTRYGADEKRRPGVGATDLAAE